LRSRNSGFFLLRSGRPHLDGDVVLRDHRRTFGDGDRR
jgi:hypothetical protein